MNPGSIPMDLRRGLGTPREGEKGERTGMGWGRGGAEAAGRGVKQPGRWGVSHLQQAKLAFWPVSLLVVKHVLAPPRQMRKKKLPQE